MCHNKTLKFALLATAALTLAQPAPAHAGWISLNPFKQAKKTVQAVQKVQENLTPAPLKPVVQNANKFANNLEENSVHGQLNKFGSHVANDINDNPLGYAGSVAKAGLAAGGAPVVVGTAGVVAGGVVGTAGAVAGGAVGNTAFVATHPGTIVNKHTEMQAPNIDGGNGHRGIPSVIQRGIEDGRQVTASTSPVANTSGTIVNKHTETMPPNIDGGNGHRGILGGTRVVPALQNGAFDENRPITTGMINDGIVAKEVLINDNGPTVTAGMVNDAKVDNSVNPGKPSQETIPSTSSTTPVLVGATGVGAAEITAGIPTVVGSSSATTQAPLVSPERQAKLDAFAAAKAANEARMAAKAEAAKVAKAERDAKVAAATAKQAENKAAMAEKGAATAAAREERNAKLAAAQAERDSTLAKVAALQAENKANLAEKNAATAAAKAEREAKLAALAESVAKQKAERAAKLSAGVNVASTNSGGPGSEVVCVYNCEGTAY